MPLIACTHCKSRFKVKIDIVGNDVKCPKCRKSFRAVALHSAPRRTHGTPPIVYAAIAVGACLVAVLVVSLARDDEPEQAPTQKTAAADTGRAVPAPAVTPPSEAGGGMKGTLLERARRVLEAMRQDDDPLLPGWVDYARMHEDLRQSGLGGPAWTDLSDTDRYVVQENLLESLLGEPATRAFARHAAIDHLDVIRMGQGRGEVAARLKNPLTGETREATLYFSIGAGAWKIHRIDRVEPAPGTGADATFAAPEIPALKRNPEGELVAVEPVEGTTALVRHDIESAIGRLTDPTATTDAAAARRKLVQIGKPALPFLLNALLPLDFSQPDQLMSASKIAQTLMELTGQDYQIVPGFNEGSLLGEGASDNEAHRRRWFGWWRDHKNSYKGPPAPGEMSSEDEDDPR